MILDSQSDQGRTSALFSKTDAFRNGKRKRVTSKCSILFINTKVRRMSEEVGNSCRLTTASEKIQTSFHKILLDICNVFHNL